MHNVSRRWRILTLLVFLMATSTFAARDPICQKCGKPIKGDRVEVKGKFYHPGCFTCAECGKPIEGEFIEHEGKFFHPFCYLDAYAPRCAWCNQPLSGKYIQIDGHNYHEQCYRDHVAERCAICGAPIMGNYIENEWNQKIHAEHGKNVPRCATCGRYLRPADGITLSDGRLQCVNCRKTAVRNIQRAEKLLVRTAELLRSKGISLGTPLREIRLELVDTPTLRKMTHSRGKGDSHGLCQVNTTLQNGRITKRDITIYLLSDLPEELFQGVAAHELFHVWQNEHEADGGSPQWREGSANVAMYLILQTFDSRYSEVQRKMLWDSDDPVYGDGFRTAWKYYTHSGLIEFLRETIKQCDTSR